MTFTVEDGTGVQGANAQVPVAFVDSYLADRNRSTEGSWSSLTTGAKQAAIVAATDYVQRVHGPNLLGVPQFQFDAVAATATVTLDAESTGSDVLTIAGVQFDMVLGSDLDVAAAALAAAIDASSLNGLILADTEVDGATLTLTAYVAGDYGNYLSIVDGTGGDVTIVAFSGGLDAGLQETPFPRLRLYDARGNQILGVPFQARAAIAEYAVRAGAATLLPDPTVDDSGRAVIEREDKVGPISERRVYDGAALSQLIRPYPAADRLLFPYLKSSGRVIR